jgi:hypothetical protein
LKSLEVHPILLLQKRVDELSLSGLVQFVGFTELVLEVIQKGFVVLVCINELLAEVSEIAEVSEEVDFEEKDRVGFQFFPALYFPPFAVGLRAELGQLDSPPLHHDETRLNGKMDTFSYASCICS